MNRLGPHDRAMRSVLPPSDPAWKKFFIEFRRLVQPALPQKQRFAAELLLREALNNAVLHGCHADPANHIRCVCCLKARRLTMVVEDWGEGFDWRAARDRQADCAASSGRGMELLETLATRVRFNKKGNRVTNIQAVPIRKWK